MKKALGMSTGPTANSAQAGYHTGGKSGNRSRGPKATSSSGQDSYYKLEEDGMAMKDLKSSESTEHLRDDQQGTKLAVSAGAAAITRTTHITVTEDSRSTSDGGSNPDMHMYNQQKAP
ncbi:hypothetical protein C8A03DRAFT_38238 [Achaetomium macrosporum]|uniref:Uncharacterized protein n=1 Tax=Achaetomium macrosporum TaxID=79813 RepID=A0AAN7C281_9PEZI|nr:hypothetical protein C8A03DRAFT_38238 [Achaetomium macrosporum]